MRRMQFILITVLFVYACGIQQNKNRKGEVQKLHASDFDEKNSKANMKKHVTYLALGDSYTIGESVNEQDRWPVQFTKQLNDMGYNISAPRIIAKTGWTTDELKTAINRENIKDTFDIVSLSIGVNNQYRGRDVENFRLEFAELLQLAIEFTGNKAENVFVLSIPDWGKTPFAKDRDQNKIEQEIAQYNQAKREECEKKKVTFIEITKLTKNIGQDSTLLAKDGLHYSGKMHQLWVNEILKIRYK